MRVGSIDVGILNLAILVADVHDGRVQRIISLERIDTTQPCTAADCALGHTKTATDRLSHVVKERQTLLETCTTILIERQPLTGLTDVEQLLFAYFRDRAVLVSPNAMHKFFNIGKYTYEGRKWRTELIADSVLSAPEHADAYIAYQNLGDRRHDVADALCLLLFHLAPKHKAEPKHATPRETGERSKKSKHTQHDDDSVEDDAKVVFAASMSRFMYQPSQKLFGSRPVTLGKRTSTT